jgi:DNA-binding LacI/PurR family transcriptional regulator
VPADVSVIGFDDHPMASYFELTTISQAVRDQGIEIAQQLVGAVARPGDATVRKLQAPTQLVVRGTTAVMGGDQRPPWAPRTAVTHLAKDKRKGA